LVKINPFNDIKKIRRVTMNVRSQLKAGQLQTSDMTQMNAKLQQAQAIQSMHEGAHKGLMKNIKNVGSAMKQGG
jgi:hypothetical protein